MAEQAFLWLAPMFLSLLQPDELIFVWAALCLEKSIIVVSDNKLLLSSAILTLQTLLSPFKWCLVSIPILPMSLVDLLDAPIPIIVGVPQEIEVEIPCLVNPKGHEETLQDKVVIRINSIGSSVGQKVLKIEKNGIEIPLPDFNSLAQLLTPLLASLQNSSRTKNMRNSNFLADILLQPNEEQQQALLQIQSMFQTSL